MIPGWLDELECEVASCLPTRGSMSVSELAAALGVSEESAASYVWLLVSARRLGIEGLALPAPAVAPARAA